MNEEQNINNLQNPDLLVGAVISRLSNGLIKQMETIFINGLKLKGFEFETRSELEQFITVHCKCIDNDMVKQKIYYVDNIPFLLHNYETQMDMVNIESDKAHTVSASYGSYAYL